MNDKKKSATSEGTPAEKPKRTRKPKRVWPVILVVREQDIDGGGGGYLYLPVKGFEKTTFSCDGDALAAATEMADFVKEHSVHIARISDRIVQKPRREVKPKMTFGE